MIVMNPAKDQNKSHRAKLEQFSRCNLTLLNLSAQQISLFFYHYLLLSTKSFQKIHISSAGCSLEVISLSPYGAMLPILKQNKIVFSIIPLIYYLLSFFFCLCFTSSRRFQLFPKFCYIMLPIPSHLYVITRYHPLLALHQIASSPFSVFLKMYLSFKDLSFLITVM